MTYNGWTNYETWCVNLWLTNEPESDAEARRTAHTIKHGNWPERRLRDMVEELYDLSQSGLAGDLIGSALGEVNWGEIVEALTEGDDEA